jgi:hypothetical protein
MHEGFDGWVRVVCAGPLALAAYATYAAHATGTTRVEAGVLPAVLIAGFAAVCAFWPERVAYAYRRGAGVPHWSPAVSVTRVETGSHEEPAETFATYRPSLNHLRSGYCSIVFYALLLRRLPRNTDEAWAFGILIVGLALAALLLRDPSPEA